MKRFFKTIIFLLLTSFFASCEQKSLITMQTRLEGEEDPFHNETSSSDEFVLEETASNIPDSFLGLDNELRNLMLVAFGLEDDNSVPFVKTVLDIRSIDPSGEQTTPVIINYYNSLDQNQYRERTDAVYMLGFLISEESVYFLEQIATSQEQSNQVPSQEMHLGTSDFEHEMMIRTGAVESLFHIADLLESESARSAIENTLSSSQYKEVRIEAYISLVSLGNNPEDILLGSDDEWFRTIQLIEGSQEIPVIEGYYDDVPSIDPNDPANDSYQGSPYEP